MQMTSTISVVYSGVRWSCDILMTTAEDVVSCDHGIDIL